MAAVRFRVSAALLALVAPLAASAQETDSAIELQLFEPAVGRSFLTVSGADTMAPKNFQVGFSATYMTGALRIYDVENMDTLSGTRTDVVKSILAGQLSGAYGLRDGLQLGVAVPVVFAMQGDGLDPATARPADGGLSITGLGDVRVEATWRFYERNGLILAAIPALSLPTSTSLSGDDMFLGDDLPSFRPRAAAAWTTRDGRFEAGANVGVILRKQRLFYSSEVGSQLTYGVAAAFHVTPKFDVIAESFGRKGFQSDLDASPLEIDGAVKIAATPSLFVTAGGGAGVIRGIGAPAMRVFASVTWSPDFRDNDNDGVANQYDRCPTQAEDKDGFNDGDGCVDEDNDEDFLLDEQDKCPNAAEDKDGFEDDDGCPELDNDLDGFTDDKDACPNDKEDKLPPIPDDGCPAGKRDSDADDVFDDKDKCPSEAEDMDGFDDEDGCPDPDNDFDGILDENDRCPNLPEDPDQYQDDDGCPEVDNDFDGILDADDKCPVEREVVNGIKDDDGCPDAGGKTLVTLQDDKMDLRERVLFETNNKVKRRSHGMLDQLAIVMRSQPHVTKWRIVVAAEKQRNEEATRATSQARADAMKAYLVGRNIDADKIEAVGAVSDSPTVVVVILETDPNIPPPPPEDEPAIEVQPDRSRDVPPEVDAEPEIEITPE